jgi:hypothetical protein
MSLKLRDRPILKATGISLILNCGLALSAFLYDAHKPPSVLLRIADAFAAPPGVIAAWIFAPKQHSYRAFVNAAAGALFCSVLFYAVIAWGFIKLIAFLRSDTAQDRGAGGRHVGQ